MDLINSKPQSQSVNSEKSSYQKGFNSCEKASSFHVIDENITNDNNSITKDQQLVLPIKIGEQVEHQPHIATPKRKRGVANLKQNTVQYLSKKHDNNYQVRCRELDLKERKMQLKEKSIEFESYERKKRLEIEEKRLDMEEKRLKMQLEIFSNQQELVKVIFSKLNANF